ncbi:MAG: hypothetical protein ACR5K5_03560 [Wolbachia sp.]
MLKSTYSDPNQKNTNRACSLPPDTCSVSDMVKVNLFTKLDDCKVNKGKLIHNKCGKDLKCKIDDKTMNELKKGLKCEIDDKTKSELKENIKSELEKSLKFEIGNKTKNELKESIKDELEKSLKFEIDDKTKNELKDEVKKEVIDEVDWCNIIGLCDSGGSKEAIDGMLIAEKDIKVTCPNVSYKNDINKPGWFTADLLKQFFPDLFSKKKITSHFYTKDGEQYHADNFAITFKCEENTKCGSNIDFILAVSSNMWCNKEGKYGNASLLCPKDFLSDKTSVCCPSTTPYWSYEYTKNFFLNNKCPNLILDLTGEELAECAGKTIVAKLEAPLIILDYHKNIIDKNGNNTGINYNRVKPYLNPDGTVKDCMGSLDCQKYAKIIDQVLWASDKEVKLKIPGNEVDDKTKDDKTEDDKTKDDKTEDDKTKDDKTDNNGETQDDDNMSTTSNNPEDSYYSEIQNELLSSYSHSGNDLV